MKKQKKTADVLNVWAGDSIRIAVRGGIIRFESDRMIVPSGFGIYVDGEDKPLMTFIGKMSIEKGGKK